jgi:hypothetical protein
VSNPFAPSTDRDIPTPSREDLLPHVHGSVRDQLAAGVLEAKHAENEWRGARRKWDEGHKRDAERRREEQQQKDSILEPEKHKGVRVHGSRMSPIEQERIYAELRAFMSEQVRAAYDKADTEQRAIIWEANNRAFDAAKRRKEEKLLRDQERMEKVLDMLQRIKEDPSKADLLPPENASISELHKWYEDMSKPAQPIPFPNPSEQQIRRERMWNDIQRTGRADPKDIAEEEAEAERYHRRLAAAREENRKKVEAEFAKPDLRQLQHEVDRAGRVMGEAAEILRRKASQPEPKKQPTLEKFFKLAESNFFMGGGVGMVIAAYAFLLGGAPRFGFALLSLSWLVISMSLWRHRFFENRSLENIWNVIVCGLIGLLLLGIWILLV